MDTDQRTGILQNGHQIKKLEDCRMDTILKNWNTIEWAHSKELEYYRMDTRSKNWNTTKWTPDQKTGIL